MVTLYVSCFPFKLGFECKERTAATKSWLNHNWCSVREFVKQLGGAREWLPRSLQQGEFEGARLELRPSKSTDIDGEVEALWVELGGTGHVLMQLHYPPKSSRHLSLSISSGQARSLAFAADAHAPGAQEPRWRWRMICPQGARAGRSGMGSGRRLSRSLGTRQRNCYSFINFIFIKLSNFIHGLRWKYHWISISSVNVLGEPTLTRRL